MARPKAKELTERELEIMHVCWKVGESTVANIRNQLSTEGRDLAYTTVATLVKILVDKGFLVQTTEVRPFDYKPARTFEEVSGSLVTDLVAKVFGGSREEMLMRMIDQKKLSKRERKLLQDVLKGKQS